MRKLYLLLLALLFCSLAPPNLWAETWYLVPADKITQVGTVSDAKYAFVGEYSNKYYTINKGTATAASAWPSEIQNSLENLQPTDKFTIDNTTQTDYLTIKFTTGNLVGVGASGKMASAANFPSQAAGKKPYQITFASNSDNSVEVKSLAGNVLSIYPPTPGADPKFGGKSPAEGKIYLYSTTDFSKLGGNTPKKPTVAYDTTFETKKDVFWSGASNGESWDVINFSDDVPENEVDGETIKGFTGEIKLNVTNAGKNGVIQSNVVGYLTDILIITPPDTPMRLSEKVLMPHSV